MTMITTNNGIVEGLLLCQPCAYFVSYADCAPEDIERISDALFQRWDGYHITVMDYTAPVVAHNADPCDGCGDTAHAQRYAAEAFPIRNASC